MGSPGANAAKDAGQMDMQTHQLLGLRATDSSYPWLSFLGCEGSSPGFTLGFHQGTPSSSMSNVVTTGSQGNELIYLALSFQYKAASPRLSQRVRKLKTLWPPRSHAARKAGSPPVATCTDRPAFQPLRRGGFHSWGRGIAVLNPHRLRIHWSTFFQNQIKENHLRVLIKEKPK